MRKLILLTALACMGASLAARAEENWPKSDVWVIVPFAAGGTTDMFARIFTNDMQAKYGKPFVVENKSGAGGTVGAAAAAAAENDGQTFLVGTASTHAIAPFVYASLRYDAEKDFQPVGLFAKVPNLLAVSNKLPIKTVQDLIDYAKAHPGELNFGSSGIGSAPHLPAELFQAMTGTKLNHVPYKASNEVMAALIAGEIDLAFDNITSALPQAQSGTIRAVAVTSPERSAAAPDLPSVAETLPGFDAQSWHGLFAPAGTPKAIVDKVSADVKRIVAKPEVDKRLKEIGAVPSPMTPEEFTAFGADERVRYKEIVSKAGIVPQ
ncbi:MFS transporter [Agaricicola taiwanensis]|uniref:MFS transporter n=1 Tax=Agaricicola taiwanensis TaxID=591372 RepID=A0A8J2VMU5_9RHOB|nr:tripartite tricarboxylate transporter substrate binding protein [Agaricicola taiwanensis]GGE39264.1 MFS transporter [Agaricicola taiwanensis]